MPNSPPPPAPHADSDKFVSTPFSSRNTIVSHHSLPILYSPPPPPLRIFVPFSMRAIPSVHTLVYCVQPISISLPVFFFAFFLFLPTIRPFPLRPLSSENGTWPYNIALNMLATYLQFLFHPVVADFSLARLFFSSVFHSPQLAYGEADGWAKECPSWSRHWRGRVVSSLPLGAIESIAGVCLSLLWL